MARLDVQYGNRRDWVVWVYAIRPGWEVSAEVETRTEAGYVRDELIEDDGYPKRWVRIRREGDGPPKQKPPKAEILEVQAQLVGAKD